MSYEVVWAPSTEQQLADIWLHQVHWRNEITAASNKFDVALSRDPMDVGESRESLTLRIAFNQPLGILFEVIEDDRKVIIQTVWFF